MLDLSSNRLTALGPIVQLPNLKRLYLASNQFDTIPSSLAGLTTLKDVSLARNDMSVFPSSLLKLDSLHALALDDNRLVMIPREIAELQSLRFLSIRNNGLVSLPRELQELNIMPYTEVTSGRTLPYSKAGLRIEGNRLCDLPHDLEHWVTKHTIPEWKEHQDCSS